MNVASVTHLAAAVPLQRAVPAVPASAPAVASAPAPATGNLSQQAAKTFGVLQGGAAFPPSATPTYVLPANGRGFSQLFNTLQAIAVEHFYPAPIFTFSA